MFNQLENAFESTKNIYIDQLKDLINENKILYAVGYSSNRVKSRRLKKLSTTCLCRTSVSIFCKF